VNDPLSIPGAREVAPGSLAQSIMYLRLSTNSSIKMPPLARNVVDSNAVTVLADWIQSLATPPVIVSISLSEQIANLNWSAMPGTTYRVQYTTNLLDGQWIDLPGDITATGPLANKSDDRGIDSEVFYRIILVP
jgi:hypothetical protein